MSVRIELPGSRGGIPDEVHAGVRFVDGVATVETSGENARKYFESIGATITEVVESDPFADLKIGDKLLTSCTVPELRDLAAAEGIDVSAKATKAEILHLFLTAFMEGD